MIPLFRINSQTMKYPTLRKVMLTTMALVASLALSAQAGRPTLRQLHNNKVKEPAPSTSRSRRKKPAAANTRRWTSSTRWMTGQRRMRLV